MPALPTVDVTLFVHNGAATVGAAIESVRAQTWPALALTLIDDGSTDGTAEILAGFAARDPAIRLHRVRRNGGAMAAFQRGFWFGDADFLLPKSADDLIAPDFVESLHGGPARASRLRHVPRRRPGVRGGGGGAIDLSARAPAVRRRPRSAGARAGRDGALHLLSGVLGRLSPCGDRYACRRSARAPGGTTWCWRSWRWPARSATCRRSLYWRRDGGKPVAALARAATEQARAGLPLDDTLAEQRWRTPLITTAYAHQEMFAAARLPHADRLALMEAVPEIFRDRWLVRAAPRGRRAGRRSAAPDRAARCGCRSPSSAGSPHQLGAAIAAAAAIVPEIDLTMFALELSRARGRTVPCRGLRTTDGHRALPAPPAYRLRHKRAARLDEYRPGGARLPGVVDGHRSHRLPYPDGTVDASAGRAYVRTFLLRRGRRWCGARWRACCAPAAR